MGKDRKGWGMMTKTVKFLIYALIFLLLLFEGIVCMVQIAYAQNTDCVLVYNDDDEEGSYDELSFTDGQGRDICKVRLYFHDAPPEENGAVFTESGEVNGYAADFAGASVHVWRSGSPYSISHSKVWVLAVPSTSTPPPPTEIPPTDVPPTEIPPTDIPPVPSATPTATAPGVYPPLPPGDTATPLPPVTGTPPTSTIPPLTTPPGPGTTPGNPHTTPMLPQTGLGEMTGDNMGLYFGGGLLLGLLALVAGVIRRAR